MNYVYVEDKVKLAVQEYNPRGGTPVVLVHGWPVNHKMYEYQLDMLANLGVRVIALDLRGFGASDCPTHGYDYERLAKDLYIVVNQYNLRSFALVGFSMGGAIAIKYMSLFKNPRVIKLGLLSAAAPKFTQTEGYPYGMTVQEVDRLIASIRQDRPLAVDNFGEMFFCSGVSPSFRSWFNGLGWDACPIATINTAITLRDADLRGELKNIKVPTTIIHGKLDRLCPYEFAEILHKNIRNSVLVPFENSGHAIFYDELDKFNKVFAKFVTA